MKCPNINDKRTRAAFNKVQMALGSSKPMGISEFRDNKLVQEKRSKLDKNAINTTYNLFDMVEDQDAFIDDVMSKKDAHLLNYLYEKLSMKQSVVNNANDFVLPMDIGSEEILAKDTKYGEALDYILKLMLPKAGWNNGMLNEYKKISTALEDSTSPLSTALYNSGLGSDSSLRDILDVVSSTLGLKEPLKLSELMQGADESSLFSIIDDNVSLNKLKEYRDGKINYMDLLKGEDVVRFNTEAIDYISTGTIDIDSPFALVILNNAAELAKNIQKASEKTGISVSGGLVDNVHYTIDSDGIVTVGNVDGVVQVLKNSTRVSWVFALNDLSIDEITRIAKENDYKIIIDKPSNTFVVIKFNDNLDSFINSNSEKLSIMAGFISDYYTKTHAKLRRSLPSAIIHLTRSVIDMPTLIEDTISVLEEIVTEANAVMSKSVVMDEKGIAVMNENLDDFTSIKNSVLIHQLDADLVPLAKNIITSLMSDLGFESKDDIRDFLDEKGRVDRSKVLGKGISDRLEKAISGIERLQTSLDIIAQKNYDNIIRVMAVKYGMNTEIINSAKNSNRSGGRDALLYSFKYINKSNVPELKYLEKMLQGISAEAAAQSNEYKKIGELASIFKKAKKENKKMNTPFKYFEVDDKGRPTLYLKDKVKWGKFFDEYARFEEYLADKYGAVGLYDFAVNPSMMEEYRNEVNEWIKENTEQPTGLKYFDAIKHLSLETFSEYSERRKQLKMAMALLTPEDIVSNSEIYKTFFSMYSDYMQMFSIMNEDGTFKQQGTDEYRKFEELMRFSEVMHEDVSDSTSEFHQEVLAHAKATMLAADYEVFARQMCRGVKLTKVPSRFNSANYMYSRALSSFSDKIYDANFILENGDILDRLYVLYRETSMYESESDKSEGLSPLFRKVWNDIKDRAGEVVANNIMYKDGYPHPIFNSMSNSPDEKSPSSMFSFSSDFMSDYTNPNYKPEFDKYDLYPNISKYSNEDYEKYSDTEKQFLDKAIEILHDINKNNGTISMYGPLLPQVALPMMRYAFRSGFGKSWKYYTHNRDVDISHIVGFNNTERVPVALFAKYSSKLADKNAIDRDLFKTLAMAHRGSVKNKVAADKMYSLHTILASLDRKKFTNYYTIGKNRIYSEFGIDVNGNSLQEKGEFNWGMFTKNILLKFTRAVQLGWNFISFGGNALATHSMIMSDNRFYRKRDIAPSIKYVLNNASRAILRKLTYGDVQEDRLSSLIRDLDIKGKMHENELRNLYGASVAKTLVDNLFYFGYSIAESAAVFPIAMGVAKNVKYVRNTIRFNDGTEIPVGFYNKQEFISRFAAKGSAGAKLKGVSSMSSDGKYNLDDTSQRNMLKIFNSIEENFYDAYSLNEKTGKWEIDSSVYPDSDVASARIMISGITNELIANATGKYNGSFNGISETVALVMGQHRQYAFNFINMGLSKQTYDPISKAETEGLLNSAWASLKHLGHLLTFQYSKARASKLDYHQLSNLKTLLGMFVHANAYALIAIYLHKAVKEGLFGDGDEDELSAAEWALQISAAMFARGSTETESAINTIEAMAAVVSKPASASHYGAIADILWQSIEHVIDEDLGNPPTAKQIRSSGIDSDIGVQLGEENGLDSDFYTNKPKKKEPKNRYGKKPLPKTTYILRNTVPGFSGVYSLIDANKTAERNIKQLNPISVHGLITGPSDSKKKRWKAEYNKNYKKAYGSDNESNSGLDDVILY